MPKLFRDDTGVSVIVGALLLILITVIAAAGLAMIVSQAEKQQADRQAQEDAIKNENLKIIAIEPYYDTNGSATNGDLEAIDITIQNINTEDAKIGQISLNDAYAIEYNVGNDTYSAGADWLTVPASKSVVVHLVVDTAHFPHPPDIKNTDQIKVQVSTSYYNFFDRTIKPPVASAKFEVNTENLGLVQRDYVVLDASDSSDDSGQIKIYEWDIKDLNGFPHDLGPIITSGNKIRFTPPSNGPFQITLRAKDNQYDENAMIGKTDVIDIPADPNFSPPLTLNTIYYLNNTTITAQLNDASGNPCPGKLVMFQPGSNIMVNQTAALTDANGIAVTNVSFSGATLGTVTVSYEKLTSNIQVSQLTVLPTANFNAFPTAPFSGDTVQFADASDHGTGSSISSWLWDFGDTTSSTLANPTHVYTNPLATIIHFTVKLTVTNSAGTSPQTVKTDFIAVKPAKPVPNFAYIVNGSGSHAIDFTGTNTGGPAISWSWNFGDGNTDSIQNPTHTYGSSGNYSVTLAVTNEGANIQITKTVAVP